MLASQHRHPGCFLIREEKKNAPFRERSVKSYLFENFFNVLSAVLVAFLGRVAVYLLRTVESSGLLYAAGGNFNNRDHK